MFIKYILFSLLFIFSCSHKEKSPEINQGKEILSKMTTEEKYKILRSYRFLQNLSGNPGRMPIAQGYLPGIPRLGIPSIEFVGSEKASRHVAREEKTLKLGFVNLIRDSAKTQVFGNFEDAKAVDSILGPGRTNDLKSAAVRGELKDLDLFLVQSGSQGQVREYVCAQHTGGEDFNCVAARLEGIIKELGIADEYDQLLANEKLEDDQLNRLAGEVLNSMDELEII